MSVFFSGKILQSTFYTKCLFFHLETLSFQFTGVQDSRKNRVQKKNKENGPVPSSPDDVNDKNPTKGLLTNKGVREGSRLIGSETKFVGLQTEKKEDKNRNI